MYVACPSCKSLYQIDPAHLRAAGGQLHCGRCEAVFRATEAVFDDPQQALDYEYPVQEDVAQEIDDLVNRALDQVPGQEPLENVEPLENEELLEIEEPFENEEPVEGTVDEQPVVSGTGLEAMASAQLPADADTYTQAVARPELRADSDTYAQPLASEFVHTRQPDSDDSKVEVVYLDELYEQTGSTPWGTIAAAVFLTVVLLGQYAYVERFRLVHFSQLRPALEILCQPLNCDLPLRSDASQVEMIDREVRAHPHVSDALLVNATLVNRADFVQSYPDFQVSFSDTSGTPVAVRRFRPREYLLDSSGAAAGMSPGEHARLMLEVIDPGDRAVSFQFEFL